MYDAPMPPGALLCKNHETIPAIARCASCQTLLCDECYRFRMNTRAACARCAYEASTRPQRRLSLAVAFVCFSWGGAFWLAQRHDLWRESPVLLGLGAIAAPAIAYFIARSATGAGESNIENREPEGSDVQEADLEPGGGVYRAHV